MSYASSSEAPISGSSQSGHHRTHAIVHRVRESLHTRLTKQLCSIFLSLVFLAGLIIFIIWLSLRPHRPQFHVDSLSDKATTSGYIVTFDLKIRNPNGNIGIYYNSDMAAALIYQNQRIAVTTILPPFYQPSKNTTMAHGVFNMLSSDISGNVNDRLSNSTVNGRVELRLEVTTLIRFRVTTWDSHTHTMHVSCYVVVGADGEALPESKEKRCSMYFG